MEVLIDPTTNDSPPASTSFRGPRVTNPAVGTKVPVIEGSTLQYLADAIHDGDRLPNPVNVRPVERRALIVAPQYWENQPGYAYAELPATVNDAFLIHKMLVRYGYERTNIRILTDRFEPDGLSDPSGENINKSLDWLVEGARPQDRRFFHFSGHGIRLDSKKGEGKQARVVSVERNNDSELSGDHGRVTKQIIPKNEIGYFNEAIVASYRPPPLIQRAGVKPEEYSLIRDKRLNEVFAKLPKGCLLTCVLDCCCSGRLIGNNTKMAGNGFRGKPTYPIGTTPAVPRRTPSPLDMQMLAVDYEGHNGVSLTPGGDNVVMFEELPWDERARDRIKAMVITWSACHQRQEAGEILESKSGILTRAFTQTVVPIIQSQDSPPPSVGEIFDRVEVLVKKDASNLEAPSNGKGDLPKAHIQYAQVWTSLGNNEGIEAFERLKQPFVI